MGMPVKAESYCLIHEMIMHIIVFEFKIVWLISVLLKHGELFTDRYLTGRDHHIIT